MIDTYPADTLADMARWLRARLDRLRVHPAGGEAVDEILAAVDQAWRAVDRPPERVYAGPCFQCGADMRARPRAARVQCPGCHAVYDVAEQQERMRNALDDFLFTSVELAGVCRRLHIPVTYQTIRYYARKGHITAKDKDRGGRARYRLGDVINAKQARDCQAA